MPADPHPGTPAPNTLADANKLRAQLDALFTQVPLGAITAYAGASAPSSDWLICNGAALNRLGTYAPLFAVIGTTYGVGNGTTTFNIPDLQGRVPVGAGAGSGLTARTRGVPGGSEPSNMPSHSHTGNTFLANIEHQHALPNTLLPHSGASGYVDVYITTTSGIGTGGMLQSNPHNHAIAAEGGGADNMPPFAVVNYLIRAV